MVIVPEHPVNGYKKRKNLSDSPRSALVGGKGDAVVLLLLFIAGTHFAPTHRGSLSAH